MYNIINKNFEQQKNGRFYTEDNYREHQDVKRLKALVYRFLRSQLVIGDRLFDYNRCSRDRAIDLHDRLHDFCHISLVAKTRRGWFFISPLALYAARAFGFAIAFIQFKNIFSSKMCNERLLRPIRILSSRCLS